MQRGGTGCVGGNHLHGIDRTSEDILRQAGRGSARRTSWTVRVGEVLLEDREPHAPRSMLTGRSAVARGILVILRPEIRSRAVRSLESAQESSSELWHWPSSSAIFRLAFARFRVEPRTQGRVSAPVCPLECGPPTGPRAATGKVALRCTPASLGQQVARCAVAGSLPTEGSTTVQVHSDVTLPSGLRTQLPHKIMDEWWCRHVSCTAHRGSR